MMTGTSATSGSALSADRTAQPSIPGIMTSSVIASAKLAGPSQALLAASRGDDPEPLLGEEALHQVPHRRLVVDHQHGADARYDSVGGRGWCGWLLDGLSHDRRQPDGKGAAPARLAVDGDVAAHHPAEPPAQRQAKTRPAVLARRGRIGLGEDLEQPRELLGRHADARVVDAELDPVLAVHHLAGH